MLKENKNDLSKFIELYGPDEEQKDLIIRYIEIVEEWS